MGKNKRRKLETNHKAHIPNDHKTEKRKRSEPKKNGQNEVTTKPTIPFEPHDRILLVGEGNFSFARSIVEHHGCADVLATCFDNEANLSEKYSQAQSNINYIRSEDQQVLTGVDAKKLNQKEIRKGQKWDRIIFNFPHVGGKSTDVNRQVRYNQELVVAFFRAASPLLASGGTIIVTLFESEPYTLWNIRDLARHVGLKVARSFKFQSSAYPGYKHARTLGNIEGGGAWQGEARNARTYVFEKQDHEAASSSLTGTPKAKRKKEESSSEEDD